MGGLLTSSSYIRGHRPRPGIARTCTAHTALTGTQFWFFDAPAQELGHPEFGHYIVKRAVIAALDGHDREREMASALLSALSQEVLPPDQVGGSLLERRKRIDDALYMDDGGSFVFCCLPGGRGLLGRLAGGKWLLHTCRLSSALQDLPD